MLLDGALLYGAGVDLTWDTLWDYTTINTIEVPNLGYRTTIPMKERLHALQGQHGQ